ncbi:UNVERIFIED_CONTAM: hypothetical protein FKN15_001250 [Acipenser sinensis]
MYSRLLNYKFINIDISLFPHQLDNVSNKFMGDYEEIQPSLLFWKPFDNVVERFMEQPEIHTGRLLVGTFVALCFNLLTMLSVKNKPFVYVSEAASTSWLQEHVADLSQSNFFAVDTASAIAIALMTFGTMYPMSVYSGKVLLQTTPAHVIGQLDKLLREVSTLDGVLEIRNEHFWTIGFGSLAGSVHVRIRRDANEQMVLAYVTNRLYTVVSTLTVQIFKDDWIRPSLATGPLPAGMLNLSEYSSLPAVPAVKPASDLNPVTSTPAKPSSPPPEFSFNTPGRNINPVILPSTQPARPYGVGLAYGAVPYSSTFSQGLGNLGSGMGIGTAQAFRTGFGNVPGRYGANAQGQFRQYRP